MEKMILEEKVALEERLKEPEEEHQRGLADTRARCRGAEAGEGGRITWYFVILRGLARGYRHFGESNAMCVPKGKLKMITL